MRLILVSAALAAVLSSSFSPPLLTGRAQSQQRAPQLLEPVLPATPFVYNDAALGIPRPPAPTPEAVARIAGLRATVARVSIRAGDNTPAHNEITDAGATLGRVLFYDTRLSANNTTSCGTCHLQEHGFSDTARFSLGHKGKRTIRHSMALGNARYFTSGRFFWDVRAASLEDAVLLPIQDTIEMGMKLEDLVRKLQQTRFYPPLFTNAFGTPDVTSEKIARALSQFIRSMISSSELQAPSAANREGQSLFARNCSFCHTMPTLSIDEVHNNGLDSVVTDEGAGGGKFKAPSLRNAGVRGPFMHDGRFKTLEEVVDFYNGQIKESPNLDGFFRRRSAGVSTVMRMNMSDAQKEALVAHLRTFTDQAFLNDARFSNPFPRRR